MAMLVSLRRRPRRGLRGPVRFGSFATAGVKPRSESASTSKSSVMDILSRSTGRLMDEIDRGEQPDPYDVNEVPVVGHHDCGGGLSRREPAHGCAREIEDEREQTTDHVQSVETGSQIEDR